MTHVFEKNAYGNAAALRCFQVTKTATQIMNFANLVESECRK